MTGATSKAFAVCTASGFVLGLCDAGAKRPSASPHRGSAVQIATVFMEAGSGKAALKITTRFVSLADRHARRRANTVIGIAVVGLKRAPQENGDVPSCPARLRVAQRNLLDVGLRFAAAQLSDSMVGPGEMIADANHALMRGKGTRCAGRIVVI
jgi:hypothetical protein